jgi:hypothetical protein
MSAAVSRGRAACGFWLWTFLAHYHRLLAWSGQPWSYPGLIRGSFLRISKTSDARVEMLVTLMLTGTTRAKGMNFLLSHSLLINIFYSVLEYLSREEAERASKELDGKELRGRNVRVYLDESVYIILHKSS